jgi:hypothetical protein
MNFLEMLGSRILKTGKILVFYFIGLFWPGRLARMIGGKKSKFVL